MIREIESDVDAGKMTQQEADEKLKGLGIK